MGSSVQTIAGRRDPRFVAREFLRSEFVRHGSVVFAASTATNIFNYLFSFAISRHVGVVGFA
ncbi:MAG: hypothetical protein ACREM8_08700, partial [Vulcanimicrobiaceae bacterium]